MNFKKILLLVLSIVMCFALTIGLTACEDNPNPAQSGSNSQNSTESANGSDEKPNESSVNSPNSSSSEETSSSSDGGKTSSSQEENSSSSGGGEEPPKPVEEIIVQDVSSNKNFVLFQTNKAEKADKQTEFADRLQDYFVGDDNAFIVKPEVSFIKIVDMIPEPYVPTEWTYVITVSRFTENNVYVDLTEADLATYVENIDAKNATVDFTAEAIGNKFKVSVYPEGVDKEELAEMTQAIEVSVVDGYNVYNAKELSYIDNGSVGDTARNEAYAKFKEDNGLTATSVSGVILQTNVNLTKNDIPGYFFYTADEIGENDADRHQVIGSLKDYKSIYERNLADKERFTIIGNYFTLSCKEIPIVVRANGEIQQAGQAYESHSELLKFNYGSDTNNETYFEMKNLNLIGNAPRVEDTTKTGGLILQKSQKVPTLIYNNIANNFFIAYFPEYSSTIYTIDKCKAYNAYSCFVYLYGARGVEIKDSEFLQAGGPVIIADHILNANEDLPSAVKVTNSNLHSYISGEEAWFQMYNATAVAAQIKSLNTAFVPFGRSFIKTRGTGADQLQFLDFVAFYKHNATNGLTSTKITGLYQEDGADPMDFGTFSEPYNGFNNAAPTLKSQFIEGVLSINAAAAIFMTSGGGISFLNPEVGLMTLDFTAGGTPTQITNPSDLMFQGEQLYLYYRRMGFVFNYFNAGETL